jgi:putative Ca2+/H+ antiporter (TMEM165/GDT1 family)
MEAVFKSFLLVAATEMGDKTQLLAFVLASRFKRPWAVMAGILVATVLNHLLAALFGSWVALALPPGALKWILGLTFIGFAAWVLVPDKDEGLEESSRFGAFTTTLVAFFLAEMGDKTQLSTVALAATYHSVALVTLGTTLGMLLADGLAVAFGEKLAERISMKWVRVLSAALFMLFGVTVLLGFTGV